MNSREQRGVVIAALCKLTPKDGQWVVPSQTGAERQYVVDPKAGTCTCPDATETGFKCKHQWAVEFTIKREQAADGTITETRTMTFTEKKVYKQTPGYTEAQVTEKHRFQRLLADLCRGVIQPPRKPGKGRPKGLLRDMAFAAVFKVYSGVSVRRFACDLADAHQKGYTTKPIHHNSVSAYLEDEALTPVLKSLIVQSGLPLRAVETAFAVDSTGFTTSRFYRWFDHKYGVERSEHDWVKVHCACGVKTGVVSAVAIYDRNAADSPVMPELVKGTAENFTVKEVSADKAYLSVENVEAVFGVGGTPYIAFKSNSTGGVGGLFERMYHFYQFNRDEYMAAYHKRSAIEGVFSAVKRKFGDSIRSRTDVAMRNEVYAKLLCHNLCRVILSQCELGIEPVFWKEPATAQAIAV